MSAQPVADENARRAKAVAPAIETNAKREL